MGSVFVGTATTQRREGEMVMGVTGNPVLKKERLLSGLEQTADADEMVKCGRADKRVKLGRIIIIFIIIITNIIIRIKNTTENEQRRLQSKQHFLYSAVGARIPKSLKVNIVTTVTDLAANCLV